MMKALKVNNNKGSTLMVVIMVVAVTSLLALIGLDIYKNQAVSVYRNEAMIQADYIAQSGAEAVAKYLEDHPEDLPNIIGTSEPVKLDGSQDYFTVTVTEVGDQVEIESLGFVQWGNGVTRTARLSMAKVSDFNFDYALYLNDKLLEENNIDIEGKVAMKGPYGSYQASHGPANIGSDQIDYNVDFDFEMPSMPEFPSSLKSKTIVEFNESAYYPLGFRLDGNYVVDLFDEDIVIRTTNLLWDSANLEVNRHGKGRLIFYLEPTLDVNFYKGSFNENGDSDSVVIYCAGGNVDMIIDRNAKVAADIFFDSTGSFSISQGTSEFEGQLVYTGTNIQLNNGADWDEGFIMAPNATLNMGNNTEFEGVAIVKTALMTNHSSVEHVAITDSVVFENDKGLKRKQWKR